MIHTGSLAALSPHRPALLTLGAFDGLHLGHQNLIRSLVASAHAQNFNAAVVTFFPHPSIVLRGPRPGFYLTTPDEKAALIDSLGVDILVTHPFTPEVSQLTAQQFIDQLQTAFDFKEIWSGSDFAFGHNREGSVDWLRAHGYTVNVITPLSGSGDIISSSRIRRALANGDLALVNACLGRPFTLAGTVVQGNQRGRTLGIPTANLQLDPDRAHPARGVYACRAWVAGQPVEAVTNIGVRPTFGGDSHISIEAHLLDFNADLYGQTLTLDFLAHLRAEQKFNGLQELIAQIQNDIATARSIFKNSREAVRSQNKLSLLTPDS
jgi:riboflavin kinase/FMN adenylyltransferase